MDMGPNQIFKSEIVERNQQGKTVTGGNLSSPRLAIYIHVSSHEMHVVKVNIMDQKLRSQVISRSG